jgi:hypothetical protein
MDSYPARQLLQPTVGRPCLRAAVPEIAVAAKYLDDAVSAHISEQPRFAEELINLSNMPAIREWTESLWGRASPYIQYRSVAGAPSILEETLREKLRMPSAAEKQLLHLRDGYHCRFCGIPLVRKEIRDYLKKHYPSALPWGRTNATQHAAFQAMWAQYDHVLPYANGGKNDLENIVVACAPCNFGRMSYTLEEVGLSDPRAREPVRSSWDGLERLLRTNGISS